jgi:DNA-directed RNA polymerase specialized sigma subunit
LSNQDPIGLIQAWQKDPSPNNAKVMLESLDPYIRDATRRHTGGTSPTAIGRAKIESLKALKSYNPVHSKPQTFLSTQLQGLSRWNASRTNGVRIPTRAAGQYALLDRAEADFLDTHGRPPSTAELANSTNLTVTAIAKLRKFNAPMVGSQPNAMQEEDDYSTVDDQALRPADDKAWLEMVYEDLPERDRVIMEHTIGMFGRNRMSTGQLAKKLKVSPGLISQRRAFIQSYVDRAMEVNPF